MRKTAIRYKMTGLLAVGERNLDDLLYRPAWFGCRKILSSATVLLCQSRNTMSVKCTLRNDVGIGQ